MPLRYDKVIRQTQVRLKPTYVIKIRLDGTANTGKVKAYLCQIRLDDTANTGEVIAYLCH